LHQWNPAKLPHHVEHEPAKAAPASSIDNATVSKIFLIVAS
jgi:hypothetical protein